MLVTLPGIATADKLMQPENAESQILVTLPGISYAPIRPPGKPTRRLLSVVNSTPSSLVYRVFPSATPIVSSLRHPANAPAPMFATLSGMITDVKASQSSKARCPMLKTPFERVTEVNPPQPENV